MVFILKGKATGRVEFVSLKVVSETTNIEYGKYLPVVEQFASLRINNLCTMYMSLIPVPEKSINKLLLLPAAVSQKSITSFNLGLFLCCSCLLGNYNLTKQITITAINVILIGT